LRFVSVCEADGRPRDGRLTGRSHRGAAARPRATSATPGATVTKLTACGATVSMSDDEGVFQIE
jgi:hypothetical protein